MLNYNSSTVFNQDYPNNLFYRFKVCRLHVCRSMSFLCSICAWMSSDMFCRRMLLMICFDSTPRIVSSLSYSPFAKKIDTW